MQTRFHTLRGGMLGAFWARYRDSNARTIVLFCIILLCNFALLLNASFDMSVHYKEAQGIMYFNDLSFSIARAFLSAFGHEDYILRLPFILIHLCNMLLLFLISRIYLKNPRDALIVVLIYALLPGIIFSALFVLKSGLIIFVSLLCCYYHLRFHKMPYLVMFVAIFIDASFAVLFFGLFFYALKNKNTLGIIICLFCFALNMYIYGLDVSGIPRNYFVSNLGKMALFFSPLLLIYYIYTLFRALGRQNNVLVYIGATSMGFVLLLSFRQDVDLETLFPMSVVALPVAIRQFFADMRIRLPMFRASYVRRFVVIFALLFAQSALLYGNKILYLFNVQNHFASSYYFSKEIATALKQRGIESIGTDNYKLRLSLSFYGIGDATSPYLKRVSQVNESYENELPIIYLGKKVASFVILDNASQTPTTSAQARQKRHKQ